MWRSDNPVARVLRVLIGFGIVALIAFTALTVIFSFQRKTEATNATARVTACEDTGPITRRGFGHNWNCTATIRDDESGETWTTDIDMNFFTPEDIGQDKRLYWGYGGNRMVTSDYRVYASPEGVSAGTYAVISAAVGFPAIMAMLWFFAKAVVWGFSQEEQRKFWEKIHGTPEQRAAKKQKELEERQARKARLARYAEIKEARRRAKEERRRAGR
ncbi:hypothetical protein F1721_16065 [Saccharopolyspora hirsuta]|uniref:Uncharacterized protein n=1 Tax=Saccharopolyspora hirsuta TaxID=1837 RepID=A0A5M7BRW9_SACHI|nr:DUF6346 domain-containing protein [Saccharopolyspora hirsuta]KAA5832519.1 hypothetical protein F1721_16065 [Saccharopolyspora hirsuta]